MQQTPASRQTRIDAAWRAYTGHTSGCAPCRSGVDCPAARTLRAAWCELVPRV
ncbi:hypothetical protein [Streptomyces sp. 8L]|uniref:hypothetical protein n=1 Tax=Streptomyces sp. 8L TaxID=2877242 RepID=UPI001CD668A2|nr:hypothetical protein [Streptomyces sp. 8L]MCA1224374.1 hypothetical protein [Streptomyces sp. 8L]